jgi:hypothetical protein
MKKAAGWMLVILLLSPGMAHAQSAGQPADPGTAPPDPGAAPPPPSAQPTDPNAPPAPVGQPSDPGTAPAPSAAPPPAGGGPPAGGQAAPAPAPLREKGLAVSLGFGVDGCTEDFCKDVDPMVFLRLQALYRFMKYAAAGLHFAQTFQNPDEGGDEIDALWFMMVGAEIRGIFPYKNIDGWMGLTLGFGRWQVDGSTQGQDFKAWMNGFTLGWGFGADYYFTEHVAVGLNFYLYKPFFEEMCSDPAIMGGDECYDLSDDAKDEIGIWWTLGLAATYHF